MASPTAGATQFATLNLDDDLEVWTEAIVKVETESLLKEFHSTTEQNEEPETDAAAVVPAGILSYNFDGPYNFGYFNDDFLKPISPATSSILTASSAVNVASLTANSLTHRVVLGHMQRHKHLHPARCSTFFASPRITLGFKLGNE